MPRRRKTKPRKPDWCAPRCPDARAELRKKATRRWPHPKGTPVTFYEKKTRADGFVGPGKKTRTRSISFYSRDGKVVVFLEDHPGYVLASHLVVREIPNTDHWTNDR